MDRGCWMLRALCLALVLGAEKQGVDAQRVSVDIEKVSPRGDPVQGDAVTLRCQIFGLSEGHTVEWTREGTTEEVLARNGESLREKFAVNGFYSVSASTASRTVLLDITNVSCNEDSGMYFCSVKNQETISVSAGLYLTILYFPIPICFPSGSFTIQEGAAQYLSFKVERGEPPVTTLRLTRDYDYNWITSMVDNNVQMQSFERIIQKIDDGKVFNFSISSAGFPRLTRTCSIGPINVLTMTTPGIRMTESNNNTTVTDRQETEIASTVVTLSSEAVTLPDEMPTTRMTDLSFCHLCQSPSILLDKFPWIAAMSGSLALLFISLIGNICLLCERHRSKPRKQIAEWSHEEFMELKPVPGLSKRRADEDEENGNYAEILELKKSAEIQHTYYKREELTRDEAPQYDTPRPQEQVTTPVHIMQHQYQNTKRFVPSSP